MNTEQSISKILDQSICDNEATYNAFKKRLGKGLLTRDENSKSHFCVWFLPYNSQTKKVFIVHHKKSGLWISPGGHIDKGETPSEAVNREIKEELGIKDFFKNTPTPFLFTTLSIEQKDFPCKAHYDIWYLVETDGVNFNIDPSEFFETKWMTIEEAKKIVSEPSNINALNVIEKYGK